MSYFEKNSNYNGKLKLNEITELATSPYSLVIEISKKFFFLPRDLIEKILLTACAICLCQTVISTLIRVYLGTFSFVQGKFPLVFQIGVLVILGFLYFIYEVVDFSIYQNVDRLLPTAKDTLSEELEQEADETLDSLIESLDIEDDSIEIDSEGDDKDFFTLDINEDVLEHTPQRDSDFANKSAMIENNASLFSAVMPAVSQINESVMPGTEVLQSQVTPKLVPPVQEEPCMDDCVTQFSNRYENVVNKLSKQITYLGDISNLKLQQIKTNVEENLNKQEFQLGSEILKKTLTLNEYTYTNESLDKLKNWVAPDYLNNTLQ